MQLRRLEKFCLKDWKEIPLSEIILSNQNNLGVQDTFYVKVKFVEIEEMTGGDSFEPYIIDSKVLKYGFQMGFVTPIVHTLNAEG